MLLSPCGDIVLDPQNSNSNPCVKLRANIIYTLFSIFLSKANVLYSFHVRREVVRYSEPKSHHSSPSNQRQLKDSVSKSLYAESITSLTGTIEREEGEEIEGFLEGFGEPSL